MSNESVWTYAGGGDEKPSTIKMKFKLILPDDAAKERDLALMAYVRAIQGTGTHTIGMNPQAMTALWEQAWMHGQDSNAGRIRELVSEVAKLKEQLPKRKTKAAP